MRPDRSLRARALVRRWGPTPAFAYGLSAIHQPERTAIVDELGTLTFAEVQRRTDALARALPAAGLDERDTVAIMCRNHRGIIESSVACSKIGVDIVYLDPGAAPSALALLIAEEDPQALIYDEEFSGLLRAVGDGRARFVAWCDPDREPQHPRLEDLIGREAPTALDPAGRRGESTVMLARNQPESASRRLPSSLVIPDAALSRIPLRPREVTMIASPIFGAWGFLHFTLAMRLASTLVLQRRFDPECVLAAIDRHSASALAVVPQMLREIVELPQARSSRHETGALRVIAVPGRQLPSDLAFPAIDRFGNVLYNLHGSAVVRLGGDWTSRRRPHPALAASSF